jgi:DNA sulfur modification protein DndD
LVTDLRIDPNSFELTLFGPELDPIPAERLSAGERQLLAVALLWGLARVAGRDLPMVIDTPLGRLDSEHRALLAERYFPHAAGQVLLLSTDEEIDESLLQTLLPSISHAYILETDPSTHATEVRSGYFWTTQEDSYVA